MEPRSRIAHIKERRLSKQLDALAKQIKDLPNHRNQIVEAMVKQEIYTVQEVAELMKVHPETIRRAIRDKRLKAFKIGSSRAPWRVSADEIDRFIRECGPGEAL